MVSRGQFYGLDSCCLMMMMHNNKDIQRRPPPSSKLKTDTVRVKTVAEIRDSILSCFQTCIAVCKAFRIREGALKHNTLGMVAQW